MWRDALATPSLLHRLNAKTHIERNITKDLIYHMDHDYLATVTWGIYRVDAKLEPKNGKGNGIDLR